MKPHLPHALLLLAATAGGCSSDGLHASVDASTVDHSLPPDLGPPPPDLAIPLRDPTAHLPSVRETYGGGPLLAHPDLVTVVWKGDAQAQRRADFAAWLASSTYLDLMDEYGGGRGTAHGPYYISGAPPPSLDNSEVGPLLRERIGAGELPPPHADIIYLLYLDASTMSTLDGGVACQSYEGYHSSTRSGIPTPSEIAYAVIPDCHTSTDDETVTVSHEVVEAMSDPQPGRGYMESDLPYGEIGDLCTSLSIYLDSGGDGGASYYVTRFYSNRNAAAGNLDPCVPVPAPPYVYFNASLDPLIPTLTLDSKNQASTVVLVEPFAFSPAVKRINWRFFVNGIPGVSASPAQGSGVPGSTQSVTLRANGTAQAGIYPISLSTTSGAYSNVIYGAVLVQ
jgi:hypothetical protein